MFELESFTSFQIFYRHSIFSLSIDIDKETSISKLNYNQGNIDEYKKLHSTPSLPPLTKIRWLTLSHQVTCGAADPVLPFQVDARIRICLF